MSTSLNLKEGGLVLLTALSLAACGNSTKKLEDIYAKRVQQIVSNHQKIQRSLRTDGYTPVNEIACQNIYTKQVKSGSYSVQEVVFNSVHYPERINPNDLIHEGDSFSIKSHGIVSDFTYNENIGSITIGNGDVSCVKIDPKKLGLTSKKSDQSWSAYVAEKQK